MTCERCGAIMREEVVGVAGGLIKVKNIFACHCGECGRVEYRAMIAKGAASRRLDVEQPEITLTLV